MSWCTKVGLFLVATVISVQASAQQIVFGGPGSEANVVAQVLRSNSSVAPIQVHLTIPQIDVAKQPDGFDSLGAPGLVPMGAYGNPDVYTTGSLIAVPEGFEPHLTVVSSQQHTVPDVLIRPAQKEYRCGVKSGFEFNAPLYKSQRVFPEQTVALEEVGSLQGLHLERVAFYPLQMDLAAKSLKVTSDVVVRVDFTRTSRSLLPVHLSKTFYQLARTVTSNGMSLGRDVLQQDSAELMLVVSADDLKESLAPFIEWKKEKGIDVKVVTFTEAGGSKESVKSYIQNFYNTSTPKPSFLLFVGNKTSLPPYFESTGSGNAATDYTFALLAGDDNIPDVFYGRLPADNANDVTLQINRWIEYEKAPISGADWYAKGTTIASNEGSNMSDKEYAQEIAKTLKAHTYSEVDGFYQGEHTATVDNITNSLKEGRTWISYFGHGSGTSWGSTNTSFNVQTVQGLDNVGRLPVIIDVACQNAAYATLSKCFGKAWVTQMSEGKSAGAVAFLGGSVNVSWHPPAIMSVGIAHYHFEKPVTSLGGSVMAGQLYLIEKKGNTSETIDNLKWYNLFGDPSLEMRTAMPAPYDVTVETKRLAHSISVSVKAVGHDGKPVQGLLAALSSDSKSLVGTAHTSAQGEATLTLEGTEVAPGAMVTITGYNAETHQVSVE